MFGRVIERWMGWPLWAKWASGITAVFAWSSIGPAIHERSLHAFVQTFIALVLHDGVVFGSFAAAIWGGIKMAKKTNRLWLGWVVGLSVMVLAAFIKAGTEKIPGIGWRIKAISDSNCYTDWDGRSNPTVCD